LDQPLLDLTQLCLLQLELLLWEVFALKEGTVKSDLTKLLSAREATSELTLEVKTRWLVSYACLVISVKRLPDLQRV